MVPALIAAGTLSARAGTGMASSILVTVAGAAAILARGVASGRSRHYSS
jgi:hypothetical protein